MIARALPLLLLLAACASDPPPPAPAADGSRPTTDTSNWQRAPTPSPAALRGAGSGFSGGGVQQLPTTTASGRRTSR